MTNNGTLLEFDDKNIIFPLEYDPQLLLVLKQGLSLATQQLQHLAQSPDFESKLRIAFGENADFSDLQVAWSTGDFSDLPIIKVLSAGDINGANGAYAAALDIVYISQEFLSQNAGNTETVASLFVEELGHRVEAQVNPEDQPGDEGAIFAALVRGETLTPQQLELLRKEDDTATIWLNGNIVEIEKNVDNAVSLLSHWKFDEAGGNVAVDSVGENDGILQGNTTFVDEGISGNAISLERVTNDVVNMGNIYDFTTGDFSISAWINTTALDTNVVVAKHTSTIPSGYILFLNGINELQQRAETAGFYHSSPFPGQEVLGNTTVTDGNWHHLVAVYEQGGNSFLYVDGVLDAFNVSQPIGGNSGSFLVGGLNVGSQPMGLYTGLIDDVQVYGSGLSAGNIQFLSQNPGVAIGTADNTLTTNEDIDLVFTADNFNFSDVDTGDSLQAVRIDTLPSEGTLYLDSNNNSVVDTGETLAENDSIAISAINAGQFKFKPDANESGTPYTSFNFSVSDGTDFSADSATITFEVSPVNDPPILVVNDGITLDQGATETIDSSELQVSDVDNTNSELTYTVTDLPDNGQLVLKAESDRILAVGDTFTQADIDAGLLVYQHDGSATDTDSFNFTVSDGVDIIDEETFTIDVRNEQGAVANVSEISDYTQIYQLDIPDDSAFGATGTPDYSVDNSATVFPEGIDRIGYYLELDTGSGSEWVWVSMDAFTQDLTKIGVPTIASGAFWQQTVSNMNVESNVADIVTGKGITTGNLEFWSNDYGTSSSLSGIGGSDSLYDFNDVPVVAGLGFGSMQIHNYGVGQTLFAYNGWGSSGRDGDEPDDLGIGNNTTLNSFSNTVEPDWTFLNNADTYNIKSLEVWVETDSELKPTVTISPTNITQLEGDSGTTTAYTYTVSLSNPTNQVVTVDYNTNDGTATVADGDYTSNDGQLIFNPGASLSQEITILVNGDNKIEPNETFTITLNNPTNATIGTDTVIGTIANDDDKNCGVSWGDPHLITFDGLAYDFQSAGEFILAESQDSDWQVQVRQQPWRNSRFVTVNTAMATLVDGQEVGIYAGQAEPLVIDGVATSVTNGGSVTVGNSQISRSGNLYTIAYAGDDGVITAEDESVLVRVYGGYLNLEVCTGTDDEVLVQGLLGNSNNNTADDFALRDGTVFASRPSFTELYGDYANSWRITQQESLFIYGDGEDTNTFTDLSFPGQEFTIDSLDPLVRANAEQLVRAAGIPEGAAFDAAVLDFAITGDETFITAAVEAVEGIGSVTIENVAPIATDDSYSLDEDTTLTIDAPGVLSNDNDLDDDSLVASVENNPINGTLELNSDGSFEYTPNLNFNGTDSFTYTISDGELTDTATVNVTVTPVNDPPVAQDDTASTPEDESLTIAAAELLDNDSDVDGDTLTIISVNNPDNGSVNLEGTDITFTPDPDFTGIASFNYTISDGNGGEATATVNVTVTPDGEHNIIEGTPGRRNIIEGTDGVDIIIGGLGTDIITGNAGNDVFVYNNIRDAGDIITDFTLGEDQFDLSNLLSSLGIGFDHVGFSDISQGTAITLDAYNSGIFRNYILVQGEGVNSSTLDNPDNFVDLDFL